MSLVFDVTADQPSTMGWQAVQELAPEEIASLAEEVVTSHHHFAPLFSRREQREWAQIASGADCSRRTLPARMSKRWPASTTAESGKVDPPILD